MESLNKKMLAVFMLALFTVVVLTAVFTKYFVNKEVEEKQSQTQLLLFEIMTLKEENAELKKQVKHMENDT